MKRIFVSVAALISASSAFAYGSPSDEGWFTFLGLIMIVFGILEIILFFKLWGMTNDIKALKRDHFKEVFNPTYEEDVKYLRENLLMGKIDNVKAFFLDTFISEVESNYKKVAKQKRKETKTYNEAEDLAQKESISPFVSYLKVQFAKIDEEVPQYILRMETYGDYFNVFQKKDLGVKVG